jgi:hypothetical protein
MAEIYKLPLSLNLVSLFGEKEIINPVSVGQSQFENYRGYPIKIHEAKR